MRITLFWASMSALGCSDPILGEWKATSVEGTEIPGEVCDGLLCFNVNAFGLTVEKEDGDLVGKLTSETEIIGLVFRQNTDIRVNAKDSGIYTIETIDEQDDVDDSVEVKLLNCEILDGELNCDSSVLGTIILEKQ